MSYYFDEERGRYFKVVNGAQNNSQSRYHNNAIQVQKRTKQFLLEEQEKQVKKRDEQIESYRTQFSLVNLRLGHYHVSSLDSLRLDYEKTIINEPYLGNFGNYSVHLHQRRELKFYNLNKCALALRIPKTYKPEVEEDYLKLDIQPANIAFYAAKNEGILVCCVLDGKPYIALFHICIGQNTVVKNYTAPLLRFLKSYKSRKSDAVKILTSTYVLPEKGNWSQQKLLQEANRKLTNNQSAHNSIDIVDSYMRKQHQSPYEYSQNKNSTGPSVRYVRVFASKADFGFLIDRQCIRMSYSKLPNLYNLRINKAFGHEIVVHNGRAFGFKGNTIREHDRKSVEPMKFPEYINHVVPLANNLFVVTKQKAYLLNVETWSSTMLGPILNNTQARQVVYGLNNEFVLMNEDLSSLLIYNTSGMKKRVKVHPPEGAKKLTGMYGALRLVYQK